MRIFRMDKIQEEIEKIQDRMFTIAKIGTNGNLSNEGSLEYIFLESILKDKNKQLIEIIQADKN